MGDIHHHAHVVLDHHHGHAELFVEIDDVARHVLLFLEVHAGHRLVEQDQLRLQRHGAGQFDALAQTIWQRAGGGFSHRLKVEEVDDLLDLAAMFEFFAARAGQPVQRARDEIVPQQMMPPDHDVVEHAHMVEQREVLEGASDTKPWPGIRIERGDILSAVKQLAFGRPVAAGDAVDDRGLAGAVRADDRKQLAGFDAEADIGERAHAAEAERYPAHLQRMVQSSLPYLFYQLRRLSRSWSDIPETSSRSYIGACWLSHATKGIRLVHRMPYGLPLYAQCRLGRNDMHRVKPSCGMSSARQFAGNFQGCRPFICCVATYR